MQVITKIKVDIDRPNLCGQVYAVQGDGNTRCVEVTLLENGNPWSPPPDADLAIAYTKPDHTKGLYNKLPDGASAITVSGSVVTAVIAPQMTTVPGKVTAGIVINNAKLDQLTTFPFPVYVTKNPFAGAQISQDYIRLKWLEDKLDEYLRKAKESGVFDGHTPEYGVEYGTPEQIAEIAQQAADILQPDVNQIKDDISALGLSVVDGMICQTYKEG